MTPTKKSKDRRLAIGDANFPVAFEGNEGPSSLVVPLIIHPGRYKDGPMTNEDALNILILISFLYRKLENVQYVKA